jgi:hypothetical protein
LTRPGGCTHPLVLAKACRLCKPIGLRMRFDLFWAQMRGQCAAPMLLAYWWWQASCPLGASCVSTSDGSRHFRVSCARLGAGPRNVARVQRAAERQGAAEGSCRSCCAVLTLTGGVGAAVTQPIDATRLWHSRADSADEEQQTRQEERRNRGGRNFGILSCSTHVALLVVGVILQLCVNQTKQHVFKSAQCSTAKYSTVLYSKYSTVLYSKLQYCTYCK